MFGGLAGSACGPSEDMVTIPAGDFVMGCDASFQDCSHAGDNLAREVALASYEIDVTEVTMEAYRECVDDGVCMIVDLSSDAEDAGGCNYVNVSHTSYAIVAGRERHPMNCVAWVQADEYCRWRDARLPTGEEWERAARGPEPRTYPWGEAPPDCDLATLLGCGDGTTSPVAAHPLGASPDGILDAIGNVAEWVEETGGLDLPIVRGGSFMVDPNEDIGYLSTYNQYFPFAAWDSNVGFRCARSAEAD